MLTKEKIRKMKKSELQEALITLVVFHDAFEDYLISELGEETYEDICTGWALKQVTGFMRTEGFSEDEIKAISEEWERRADEA